MADEKAAFINEKYGFLVFSISVAIMSICFIGLGDRSELLFNTSSTTGITIGDQPQRFPYDVPLLSIVSFIGFPIIVTMATVGLRHKPDSHMLTGLGPGMIYFSSLYLVFIAPTGIRIPDRPFIHFAPILIIG